MTEDTNHALGADRRLAALIEAQKRAGVPDRWTAAQKRADLAGSQPAPMAAAPMSDEKTWRVSLAWQPGAEGLRIAAGFGLGDDAADIEAGFRRDWVATLHVDDPAPDFTRNSADQPP